MTDEGVLTGQASPGTRRDSDTFAALATRTLDELLERHPEAATSLGDHRFDDRLTDLSPQGLEDKQRWASRRLAELEALPLDALMPADRVDAQILAGELRSRLYGLQELRDHEWDPLVANPGTAIYTLLAREFAPHLFGRMHAQHLLAGDAPGLDAVESDAVLAHFA